MTAFGRSVEIELSATRSRVAQSHRIGELMGTKYVARADREILVDIENELELTPDVDSAGIGVTVDHGTVALIGEVGSFAERLSAVRAALRVRGVSTIVDDLFARRGLFPSSAEPDTAKEVEHALAWVTEGEVSPPHPAEPSPKC